VVVSFADDDTRALANGQRVTRFKSIERVAVRKIRQLEVAGNVNDLRVPPGNRLEKLQGDWAGFYSIRINDQWRLCFYWSDLGPEDVQIIDYH
jgi:proteic killer suppression protein